MRDNYNIREAMLADAAASALGAVFGCCYPNCVFIGVINIEVAFTAVPKAHIPAVAMAILPFVGEFAKEQIDAGVEALGYTAPFGEDVLAAFASQGINYQGFSALAYGTIILSMLIAAIVVFVIERRMMRASITAFVGAACSFVGLIHSPQLAINANPQFTIAWAMIGAVTLIAALYMRKTGAVAVRE